MNTNYDNENGLVEELRQLLKPQAPSENLGTRIRGELSTKAGLTRPEMPLRIHAGGSVRQFVLHLVRNLSWLAAGAVATCLAIVYIPAQDAQKDRPSAKQQPAAREAFEREASSSELLATEDSEEVIETTDGPAREVTYEYRERHEWMNPVTGARVVLEVPRQDVYLLPLTFQ